MFHKDMTIAVVELGSLCHESELVSLDRKRNLRKERHGNLTKIILALYRIVQNADEEDEGERYSESKDHGRNEYQHLVWRNRAGRSVRAHDKTGVSDIDQRRDLIFLTFFHEEDIERLLDHLLSLDRKELKLLT